MSERDILESEGGDHTQKKRGWISAGVVTIRRDSKKNHFTLCCLKYKDKHLEVASGGKKAVGVPKYRNGYETREDAEEDAVWFRLAVEFSLLDRFEKNISRATPEFIELAKSIGDQFFNNKIPCSKGVGLTAAERKELKSIRSLQPTGEGMSKAIFKAYKLYDNESLQRLKRDLIRGNAEPALDDTTPAWDGTSVKKQKHDLDFQQKAFQMSERDILESEGATFTANKLWDDESSPRMKRDLIQDDAEPTLDGTLEKKPKHDLAYEEALAILFHVPKI